MQYWFYALLLNPSHHSIRRMEQACAATRGMDFNNPKQRACERSGVVLKLFLVSFKTLLTNKKKIKCFVPFVAPLPVRTSSVASLCSVQFFASLPVQSLRSVKTVSRSSGRFAPFALVLRFAPVCCSRRRIVSSSSLAEPRFSFEKPSSRIGDSISSSLAEPRSYFEPSRRFAILVYVFFQMPEEKMQKKTELTVFASSVSSQNTPHKFPETSKISRKQKIFGACNRS